MPAKRGSKVICPNCSWENFARATHCQVCKCPLVVAKKSAAAPTPTSGTPSPSMPSASLLGVLGEEYAARAGVGEAREAERFDPNWIQDARRAAADGEPDWRYTGDEPPAEAILVEKEKTDFWHIPAFDPLELPPEDTLPPPPANLSQLPPPPAPSGDERRPPPPPPSGPTDVSRLPPPPANVSSLPPPPAKVAPLPPPPRAPADHDGDDLSALPPPPGSLPPPPASRPDVSRLPPPPGGG